MKKKLGGTITLILILLVAAPLWATTYSPSNLQAKLFNHISKKNPYTTWQTWTDSDKRNAGSGAHGTYIKKYVNDKAYKALSSGAETMPYGSIIVQENYSSWGLMSITVMLKEQRGFNPRSNDWFFVTYSPNGAPRSDEREDSCLSCHNSESKTDLLISDFHQEIGKVGKAVSSFTTGKVN